MLGVSATRQGKTVLKTRLYTSDTPEFASRIPGVLRSVYEGIADPAIKQSTIILVNEDDRAVAGYVIRWTYASNGEKRSFFQTFSEERQIDEPAAPIGGFGLKSRDARLLSPSFNVHSSETADSFLLHRINTLGPHTASAAWTKADTPPTAQIDAIIYADSTIYGPDETAYGKRFVAERNAMHDEGVSVLLAEEKGESLPQIQERLQRTVSIGQLAATSTSPDHFYLEARARWAQKMLFVQTQMGQNALMLNAKQAARVKAIHLTQMPPMRF